MKNSLDGNNIVEDGVTTTQVTSVTESVSKVSASNPVTSWDRSSSVGITLMLDCITTRMTLISNPPDVNEEFASTLKIVVPLSASSVGLITPPYGGESFSRTTFSKVSLKSSWKVSLSEEKLSKMSTLGSGNGRGFPSEVCITPVTTNKHWSGSCG